MYFYTKNIYDFFAKKSKENLCKMLDISVLIVI